MKRVDHREQAEQLLEYADLNRTGGVDGMFQSATTHALLALIERVDVITCLLLAVFGEEE